MGTTKRRSYTTEQRKAVVETVLTKGVCGAAKKHGVPESCVSRWAKDAGVQREGTAPSSQRSERVEEDTAEPARVEEAAVRVEEATPAAARVVEPPRVPAAPATAPASAPAVRRDKTKPWRRARRSRVAKSYTPSQKAVILEDASKDGVTAAASKHDVSRFSIYEWQRKVQKAAVGEGPSPTSGPSPVEIEATRDKEVLDEWHKHPGLGPSQIVNQLASALTKTDPLLLTKTDPPRRSELARGNARRSPARGASAPGPVRPIPP